ncbi:MAG: alpha/beta hydrolase [Lachnospiraceae bacterium]|nr:alpha/beta hydrolase [Lachnospiraceae bacterium]
MEKILPILICAVAVLVILILVMMFLLARFVLNGNRQTLAEAKKWQAEHYDIKFYDKLEKHEYIVRSFDGYKLHVQICQNPVKTGRYVIISHGYTDNRYGDLKYVRMYLELGYNCIIYDLRGHGVNARHICTYSVLEAKDLMQIIEDTRNRYVVSTLGLHGESLGGATSIACLQYQPNIDWVVDDCGFADLENVLRRGYASAHLPAGITLFLTRAGMKLFYGKNLGDMAPIKSVENANVPVLFIHGADDDFVPPENSERMYSLIDDRAQLKIMEGAGHAESVLNEPVRYEKFVRAFLSGV